jgi:DNA-binding transcriptional LysR family regulator
VLTLDLELLRTLSLVQETGTLARASRRVGRTLSAVSLQL